MRSKEDRLETPSVRNALGGVVEQIRAEQRWLNLMRLVVGGTMISWALFFAGMPWSNAGVPLPSFEMSSSLRFILLITATFGSCAYWIVWRPTLRHETSWEFIRVVFGATLLIRTPGQFKSRLGAECGRRKATGEDAFSLLSIQLAGTATREGDADDERELERNIPALVVRSIARAGDVVAEGPDGEILVLALRASNDGRDSMARRIAGRLHEGTESFPVFDGARIGGATFPDDGLRHSELLSAARDQAMDVQSYLATDEAA